MARLPTLDTLDVSGATVLLRADLNVPLDGGRVADDFRIVASLPTIRRLRERGAKVVVCSHLGRPKGRDEAFSLRPVTARLAELGGFDAVQLDGVAGPEVAAAIAAAAGDQVLVLENTRFEPGETKNDPDLADALAAPADAFVLDAFGSAHRAHASTVGVAERLRSAAGPLLAAEVEALSRLLGDPERPFVVVLGGAKISDKLAVMRHLLPRVDRMLVGGGMCFTLLAGRGLEVGSSLVDADMIGEVAALQEEYGARIVLPDDLVIADRFAADAATAVVPVDAVRESWMGLDIGPATVERFGTHIREASSLFWNGPMGVFEWEPFRSGTAGVAEAAAECEGFSVIGGGDSVAAIRALGRENDVSHVSTGGGAGLEMLEGKMLPGVAALDRWTT